MTTDDVANIRAAIEAWRDAEDMRSVRRMGLLAGIDPTFIYHIVGGRRTPTIRTIGLIRNNVPDSQEICDAMLQAIGIHPIADRLNRVMQTDCAPDVIAADVTEYLDSFGAPS